MKTDIQAAAERIARMEEIFDRLLAAAEKDPGSIRRDTALSAALDTLLDYYENGTWLRDHETDEAGLLPAGLKRGVLSEDGVYDLLTDIQI